MVLDLGGQWSGANGLGANRPYTPKTYVGTLKRMWNTLKDIETLQEGTPYQNVRGTPKTYLGHSN